MPLNNGKATILGAILAAVLAINVDYGKLMNGDAHEIGKVVGVVATAILGFYTNKPDSPKAVAEAKLKELKD